MRAKHTTRHPINDTAGQLAELADEQILTADAVRALPPNSAVDRPWIWEQSSALAEEQDLLFDAEGQVASRDAESGAKGLTLAAEVARGVVATQEQIVTAAATRVVRAREALTRYVTRESGAKGWYYARMGVLYGGDVAGITGSAIMNGEIPALAIALAISVGAAAVIGGLAGSDAKKLKLARERAMDPRSIGDDLREFAHLFWGVESGRTITKLMAKITAGIIVAILTGILCMRWSSDGLLAGITYGSLSTAIALASLWNAYAWTDPVADLLEYYDRQYDKAAKRLIELADSARVRVHDQLAAEAASIQTEYADRGQAAGRRIDATKYKVMARHPEVVGTGPASLTEPAGRRGRDGA